MARSIKKNYELNKSGEFIITDYNSSKLFSSFFPGVAGKVGIPMWLFYVNRGQCVCSMGVEDKEHPIMEFLPANRAYQLTSSQGFRTFIKPLSHKSIQYYEPFQKQLASQNIDKTQRMIIAPAKLILEEDNHTLGLKFTVEYFNIVQDDYTGLVRTLSIQNLNEETFCLEGLDGLPLIIPYGINNSSLKLMRRLMEAFVEVSNYEQGVPFFRGKVEPSDRPEVVKIKKGNFYVGFETSDAGTKMITPIVDPVKIFGSQSDYSYPEKYLSVSVQEMYEGQILENRLPCSMGHFQTSIAAGETYTYTSIIGHSASIEDLNEMIPRITKREYVKSKTLENEAIIDELTQKNFICSQNPVLDQYARQNFLDNTLRGGFPFTMNGKDSSFTLHLYSRKHGDLERDYNDYRLTPTNYSQGNGNYRDVNQNRRNDLLLNPDIKEDNVEQFYSLIQLDGFNPLVIKETHFKITDNEKLNSILSAHLSKGDIDTVVSFLQNSFTPGGLTTFLKDSKIDTKDYFEAFIIDLISICQKEHATGYGEGFWTDHWTYNLDLLENYLTVYPENLQYILFEKKIFSFYDNPHRVLPRDEKYVIWEGNPMQLGAVILDEEKEMMISERKLDKNLVHTEFGKGQVYHTSLINKMLCLIVNKMASLDPEGVGVEMETDKPNWYDALNGLPGLIGSSISETLEIKRHILFLQQSFQSLNLENTEWPVFAVLKVFIETMYTLLQSQLSPFEFWDKAESAKELYRSQTRFGISGNEKTITQKEVEDFFATCLKKLNEGIEKAWDKKRDVISTYFINKVVEYQEIKYTTPDGEIKVKCNARGLPYFKAKKFIQIPLPLFLEGPVHYLRCHPDSKKAKKLVENIKKSGLFDKKLKMYKVNASLTDQPMEIGRARTFSPGWFENESIWLHMEYKYMLELLRNELYQQFYEDFTNVFVPFFRPEIYGRSILENSSFICSSANPDPSIHGNGFVARLSGATAEFIHIMFLMAIGPKPFSINLDGELQLHFKPALPGWLFTQEVKKSRLYIENEWQVVEFAENTFSFMFLGEILVTFHNKSRKETFGLNGVVPFTWEVIDLDGNSLTFQSASLKGEIAEKIRNRKVRRINIELC